MYGYDEADKWTTDEGYRVTVYFDHDEYNNPRQWDNIGTMVCWDREYDLGDEQIRLDPDYIRSYAIEVAMDGFFGEMPEGAVVLPLYLYEHSGISMRCGSSALEWPFDCKWDTRPVGFIYVTPEKMAAERISAEEAHGHMESEVEVYDKYLMGMVYGYKVEKPVVCDHGDTHWELIDSCGGYFDEDDIALEWPKAAGG